MKEKKKKKRDKLPPKMVVTESANLVLIVPAGPVRPMQIHIGSIPALPVSKIGGASPAKSN